MRIANGEQDRVLYILRLSLQGRSYSIFVSVVIGHNVVVTTCSFSSGENINCSFYNICSSARLIFLKIIVDLKRLMKLVEICLLTEIEFFD